MKVWRSKSGAPRRSGLRLRACAAWVGFVIVVAAAAPARGGDEGDGSGGSLDAAVSSASAEDAAPHAPASARATQQQAHAATLASRIASVTRRRFVGVGRSELQAQLGLSLADPFYANYALGAGFAFHVLESLALGVSGAYTLVDATPPLVAGGSATQPEYDHLIYAAHADVTWAPLYGKLSLLAERVLHFDTFGSLGGGIVGAKHGGTRGLVTVAVGQHYFVNSWVAVLWELRDQIFRLSRAPSVGASVAWENFLSLSLGVSFYLPRQIDVAPSAP